MLSPIPVVARRILVGVATGILAAGCATSSAFRRAEAAEHRQDYDRAVAEYTNALRRHPNDTNARLALDRTKLRAAADHFQRGRRLSTTGKLEEALVEYELAAELNPTSVEIDRSLRDTRNQLRTRIAVSREGKTELQTIVERTRDLPPIGISLPADVRMPASLAFRDASSRDAFLSIGRLAGISVGFDPAFRDTPVTVDLRSPTLEGALTSVADATRTFYRITGQKTVLVIPDTPAKRREYEEEVVRTFYLSNADLKETQDLMRLVLDARRVSPTTATNALTIKDTPARIAAAARLIGAIDKARPEVVIDVELLEVDRTRLQEYGLQPASPGSPGLNGSASIDDGTSHTLTLNKLRNLTQADLLLANLPALYYRLLRTDTSTRTLANPQLRTAEGMPAKAQFGEQIPIPVTTFAPLATGGTAQQPITSFNYQNIGVNIDITPRMHHNDEVTLSLKVAVQSVSGVGFGGLPTFGNREINTVIRLRDGETNMLAGLIRDDERRVVDGIPGLVDVPLIGRLFAHSRTESSQTDIILTLTPHIVRVLDVDEVDLRAFRVGRDSLTPITEIATPIELPRPTPAETPGTPGPVRPIQPPQPQPSQPQPPATPPAEPPPPTPRR
jgi:general secretion pathway protein D